MNYLYFLAYKSMFKNKWLMIHECNIFTLKNYLNFLLTKIFCFILFMKTGKFVFFIHVLQMYIGVII